MKLRFVIGMLVFLLMSVNWAFVHLMDEGRPGSYDGWTARRTPGSGAVVTAVDPQGPATALQIGDELLSLNRVPINDGNPAILNFNRTVPPGTRYLRHDLAEIDGVGRLLAAVGPVTSR